MTLRTPNPFTSRQTLMDIQRLKERSAGLQEQISSGRRIQRLSDDPTASALVVDFKNSVQRNEQFIRLIQSSRNMLQTAESTLGNLDNSIVRLLELGQQGLSSTTGASGRANISAEVDGIRTNIITYANTQADGKYIFAGTRTTVVPFSGPAAGPITYAGDANSITVDVSVGGSVTTNLPGDRVFFGTGGQGSATDIFQAVTDMRDALTTNNVAQLQTAYNNLKAIQTHMNDMVTELGGRQSSLDDLEANLGRFNDSLKAIQGTYEDLSYPEAIAEYNRVGTAQEAALATLARAGRQNLFDYLG